MASRFKGVTGKYFTKQLFWEQFSMIALEHRSGNCLFTLYQDRPEYINFGKVYVELGDPSGYKITQKLLDGDYTLWTVLMGCRWFVAAKEHWDRELDAKLYSEGMDEIRTLAKDGMPAQKLAAAKFLATKEYKKNAAAGKGRPKREDIDRAARDMAETDRDLEADILRIKGQA